MSDEPIREVRCIHCGDYTPGVYEAHHKEMIRQLKTALEEALKQLKPKYLATEEKL